MNVVQFLMIHLDDIFAILGASVTLASLIVALTPSHADDAVVGAVRAFIERLSVVKHTEGRQ